MTAVDEYLPAAEVAAEIRVSPGTLRSWRALNKGPRSFKVGRKLMYLRSELDAWKAEQQQATSRGGAA
jgi:predicted DNA-binding transcriptional regulator AlpA